MSDDYVIFLLRSFQVMMVVVNLLIYHFTGSIISLFAATFIAALILISLSKD